MKQLENVNEDGRLSESDQLEMNFERQRAILVRIGAVFYIGVAITLFYFDETRFLGFLMIGIGMDRQFFYFAMYEWLMNL